MKIDPEELAELRQAFGARLQLARKAKGLTMRGLADQLETRCTPQMIHKYEHGKSLPSSRTLVALGKALDCSLDFLMATHTTQIEWRE